MSLFTPLETEFLLAHLATVSAAGQPCVVPTIHHFADGVFRIGARPLGVTVSPTWGVDTGSRDPAVPRSAPD